MRFRIATHADIPAVVALVESGYRGAVSRGGWTTEADLLDGQRTDVDDVRSCIDGAGGAVLLCEVEDNLTGCAHVSRDGDAADFGMFSVAPAQQRHGVGKALLAEAERYAREVLRVRVMRMTVIDVRSELLAFYERRGYASTGRTKPFPYGDERFGVPRRGDLRFVVLEKNLLATK